MTEENFAYWLQGYFEISESVKCVDDSVKYKELSIEQIELIKKHINLVRVSESNSFFVSAVELLLDGPVETIIRILSAQFEHVIDLKHPKPLQANEAHGSTLNSTLIRC